VVTPAAIQCDIQQNTSHVGQHHIFHIKKWCCYDIQHTAFAFLVWLSHDSCHHNVSQCYASEKFFLFGQVLEDDHVSPVNGVPHVDKTPEKSIAFSSYVSCSCQAFCNTNSKQNKIGLKYHFISTDWCPILINVFISSVCISHEMVIHFDHV